MKSLWQIFWISLAIKLALAAVVPLSSDESYYWVWSQHMQLSYYDHPPIVAWLFWLGNFLDFYGGMVRWPGVLLGHAALAVWLQVLKPFLDDSQRRIWLLMALTSPLVGGSAILLTPDLPLMFFYAVALWTFFRWEKEKTWGWALALGLAMGVGFSSKYMMVLFALSLLPYVLWKKDLRSVFFRHLHLIVLGGLLGTLPVWLWNLLHDFASIKFQTKHGLGAKVWKPSWTVHYIAAQIGIIFPAVLYSAMRARRLPWSFHLLAWVPLAFFFFTTFRGYVEANWPIVAYPLVFALAASLYPRNQFALKGTVMLWTFLMAGLAAVIVLEPGWSKSLKFREFHQFDNVIQVGKDLSPFYTRSYQMAAKLHFEWKRPVYKLQGMNRKDFYDFLDESEPTDGFYYIAVEKKDRLPKAYTERGDKLVETIPVDEVYEIRKMEIP